MKVSAELEALCAPPLAAQQALGYVDTLREILQQPATWLATAELLRQPRLREQLQAALSPRPGHIVLTGSGSSMYIGDCLAPSLQLGLGIPTQAIAAGSLLTHWRSVLPAGAGLLISLARSGDSPESTGVVDRQCKVHGMDNLHIAGSSVFPTGGWAFPTFTIVALSLRLADELRGLLATCASTGLL